MVATWTDEKDYTAKIITIAETEEAAKSFVVNEQKAAKVSINHLLNRDIAGHYFELLFPLVDERHRERNQSAAKKSTIRS